MKQYEIKLFSRTLVLTYKAASLCAIAALTFILFIATTFVWGGDALNGKIDHGRYYLAEGAKLHEVGRIQYALSAALITIWPPTFFLAIYSWMQPNLSAFFPQNSNDARKVNPRKLFLVVMIFIGSGTVAISIASLLCLLKALF